MLIVQTHFDEVDGQEVVGVCEPLQVGDKPSIILFITVISQRTHGEMKSPDLANAKLSPKIEDGGEELLGELEVES